MVLRAQQHTANQVGRGDARGSLDHSETTRSLDVAIAIIAVTVRGNVIAMDDISTAVVRNPGQVGDVWSMGHALSSPPTSVHCGDSGVNRDRISAVGEVNLVDERKNCLPFLQRHHRRTLVFQNCLVGMDTHVKFLAESASLQHGTGMASKQFDVNNDRR